MGEIGDPVEHNSSLDICVLEDPPEQGCAHGHTHQIDDLELLIFLEVFDSLFDSIDHFLELDPHHIPDGGLQSYAGYLNIDVFIILLEGE